MNYKTVSVELVHQSLYVHETSKKCDRQEQKLSARIQENEIKRVCRAWKREKSQWNNYSNVSTAERI